MVYGIRYTVHCNTDTDTDMIIYRITYTVYCLLYTVYRIYGIYGIYGIPYTVSVYA